MIAAQVAFALERTRAEESLLRLGEAIPPRRGVRAWQTIFAPAWSPGRPTSNGSTASLRHHTFDAYEQLIHHDDRDRVVTSIHQAIEVVPTTSNIAL